MERDLVSLRIVYAAPDDIVEKRIEALEKVLVKEGITTERFLIGGPYETNVVENIKQENYNMVLVVNDLAYTGAPKTSKYATIFKRIRDAVPLRRYIELRCKAASKVIQEFAENDDGSIMGVMMTKPMAVTAYPKSAVDSIVAKVTKADVPFSFDKPSPTAASKGGTLGPRGGGLFDSTPKAPPKGGALAPSGGGGFKETPKKAPPKGGALAPSGGGLFDETPKKTPPKGGTEFFFKPSTNVETTKTDLLKVAVLNLFGTLEAHPLDMTLKRKLALLKSMTVNGLVFSDTDDVDGVNNELAKGAYAWVLVPVPSRFLVKDDKRMEKAQEVTKALSATANAYAEDQPTFPLVGRIFVVTDFPTFYPLQKNDISDEVRHAFQVEGGMGDIEPSDPWVGVFDLEFPHLFLISKYLVVASRKKTWKVFIDHNLNVTDGVRDGIGLIVFCYPIIWDPKNDAFVEDKHTRPLYVLLVRKVEDLPKKDSALVQFIQANDGKLFVLVPKGSQVNEMKGVTYFPSDLDKERLTTKDGIRESGVLEFATQNVLLSIVDELRKA